MLTTKKFIKEVEKLGFEVDEGINIISIYDGDDEIAYVYKDKRFYAGTYCEFSECLEELQEKLYDLLYEYARTLIDEREKTVKFFLRFKGDKLGINNYLNYSATLDWLVIREKMDSENFKTQFTQKEIDEIREKFKVTLCDFEQIPVKEDEKKEWSEEE